MATQGSLKDISVTELIQNTCQERRTASLVIRHQDQSARLFFRDGNVVHAVMDDAKGEEVLYSILAWDDGLFSLETGVKPPAVTIKQSWSSLLLEGARRLDENQTNSEEGDSEKQPMAQKIVDILKEMSTEVNGFLASAVVSMDGISIASHSRSSRMNMETVSAHTAMLMKLVDTTAKSSNTGILEDELVTTANTLGMYCFLSDHKHFLCIVVDRKSGNLGNLRLMCRIYAERVSRAMPH